MTFVQKLDLELILCTIAVAAFSGFLVVQNNKHSHPLQLTIPIVAGNNRLVMPKSIQTDTILNTALPVEMSKQPSPDGQRSIVLRETQKDTNTRSYSVKTFDQRDGSEHLIYTASSSASEQLDVPFNAWSPDNKYVFIQKKDGDALVFNASGEDISPGQKYLDVGQIFKASGRANMYRETTGWASDTLLIVNTTTKDNAKGSSYWFEVPTKAIIQLSSQF